MMCAPYLLVLPHPPPVPLQGLPPTDFNGRRLPFSGAASPACNAVLLACTTPPACHCTAGPATDSKVIVLDVVFHPQCTASPACTAPPVALPAPPPPVPQGLPPTDFKVNVLDVVFHQKKVAGSIVGGRRDMNELLQFCADKDVSGLEFELLPWSSALLGYGRGRETASAGMHDTCMLRTVRCVMCTQANKAHN